jgi:arylsulfatase A-like enzyme
MDYLAVGFSQPDYVGHRFGPLSREQLDELLRLDRLLGTLMTRLDEQVGEGGWVLALSGDHGAVDLPEWRTEQGASGGRVSRDDLRAIRSQLNEALDEGGAPDEVRDRVARFALALPFIEAVYPKGEPDRGEPADSFAVLFRNSHLDGRVYGLLGRAGLDVRLTEGWISDGSVRGTTHGSPYWYDRHVPLFFLGRGVSPGRSDEPAYTVDVAPTLALLAGVAAPGDLDGRPLF